MKKRLILLLIFCLPNHSFAGRFNFGVGAVGFKVNHYRGSDQTKSFLLPVPYVFYQGENIKAESAVISGKFFSSRFFSVSMSLTASPNVENDTNDARKGMKDLNYNFGIGPRPVFHLYKSKTFDVNIEFPVRREFETDFRFTKGIGYSATGYFSMVVKPKGELDWSSGLSFGYLYGDSGLHGYYYNVGFDQALAGRPAYTSKGGYSGRNIIWYFKKRIGSILIFPFLRYDDLSGVVFEDSPLVKQKNYFLMGLGLFHIWI